MNVYSIPSRAETTKYYESRIAALYGALKRADQKVAQLSAELDAANAMTTIQQIQLNAIDLMQQEPDAMEVISQTLSEFPGVTWPQIIGRTRTRDISKVRMICMARVKKQCPGLSYPDVSRIFARSNHVTVIHACRVAKQRGWVE